MRFQIQLFELKCSFESGIYDPRIIRIGIRRPKIIRIRSATLLELSNLSMQCCGSGMVIPDPNFSIPDQGLKKVPDPDLQQRI
jgi:hypothetical protein